MSSLEDDVSTAHRTIMKLVDTIDAAELAGLPIVRESNEFAMYDIGCDTFVLVHRHEAVRWQAVIISGDGIFRVLEMLAEAARVLYRDMATDLSAEKRSS